MAASKGIGRLIQFGAAKESTRGTAPSSATYWYPYADGWIEEHHTEVFDEEAYGIIEDTYQAGVVKQWSEGNVKLPLTDGTLPLMFLSLLGTDTPATHSGETTVYDHAITVAENAQHQSLAFYMHDPLGAQDYNYPNGVVHKANLDYQLGKYQYVTFATKALKGATHAAYTPATTAENRFLPQHLTFKVATNIAGLTGASATKIINAKISIQANTVDYDVLGSTGPADFLNQSFNVTGTIEAIWQNESDFKTAFLANTVKALRFDYINNDVTLGTAANPEFRIDLAKVYFEALDRPSKVNEYVKQTLKFRAVYSSGDTTMINVLFTNIIATY